MSNVRGTAPDVDLRLRIQVLQALKGSVGTQAVCITADCSPASRVVYTALSVSIGADRR